MPQTRGIDGGDRIRRGRDFKRAYSSGERMGTAYFVAFVRATDHGRLRVGVVASRRVGGSVRRNRAKRLLREAFRLGRRPADVSADVVLVARAAIAGADFGEVSKVYARTVERALERVH